MSGAEVPRYKHVAGQSRQSSPHGFNPSPTVLKMGCSSVRVRAPLLKSPLT